MNINWYPGHMAKSKRQMEESLAKVDAVAEVIDARIPSASRNPVLLRMAASKARIIIFNRVDQADRNISREWLEYYRAAGEVVLPADSKSGRGCGEFPKVLRGVLSEKVAAYERKGQPGRMLRVMVAGIPNVGKSSFINRVSGRKAAKAEDRPGVTRAQQWIRLDESIEMLDTPGMLWPRLDDKDAALLLAFTGAIRDEALDIQTLGLRLCEFLGENFPGNMETRYGIKIVPGMAGVDIFERIAAKRGFIIAGGEVDYERCASVILDELRQGLLGNMTLERPLLEGANNDQ